VSLIARFLEAGGTPTLCTASALDIITAGNPPRAVFVDYPLGNTLGHPGDAQEQYAITRRALEGFETIQAPGEIVHFENDWGDDEWRGNVLDASLGDQRAPRDEVPRYQFEEDRIAAEGA
jgi:hypothetical protein